ncbi:MAG TPA: abortive infection system antitoxin AbiGi family protein [Paludibacter sp.]
MERTKRPLPKLSQNLSSDTLFTFTSKLEYLTGMIENGIKPRYICERIPIPDKTWNYTVAAKCFCDIPLGMIKSHLNWFGNFGLGIKKKYLQELGVSPVIYIHSNSKMILNTLNNNGFENLTNYPTLPYLKRYSGDDYKFLDDGTQKRFHRQFYDEREWRYIPEINNLTPEKTIKTISEGLINVSKKNIETPYDKTIIALAPSVIEYIIIEKYSDFKELKTRLKSIFQFDDAYELMLSKILIAERILRDF